MFDRLFHLTRGGVSKASKVINLSEDIFAGKKKTFLSEENSFLYFIHDFVLPMTNMIVLQDSILHCVKAM